MDDDNMTIDVIVKVLHISNFSSANTTLDLSMDHDINVIPEAYQQH